MTLRLAHLTLAFLCAFGCAGCQDRKVKEARRLELVALMHGNTADPEMKAAIEKARATLPVFLGALKAPKAGQRQFMVRKAFPTKEAGKQQILIVNNVTLDGAMLRGVLDDNTAVPGSGVDPKGAVTVKPEEICDWMFNEDGKAVGGWMLRALKNKMTDEEWAGIARQIEFKD
jgi:uncharacterized protein YegJ (DUF2314 family)